MLAGEGHIPLACTPDASSAAPISGLHRSVRDAFHHEMSVRRVLESPRVTRPYTDPQWREHHVAGQRWKRICSAQDVRLTMGGEPTFVSLDDPDGAEWTTAAMGPNKRRLAVELLLKLRDRFAPARCCISARANGIRASRCLAGRSAATGAKTACRSGKIRPDRRREQDLRLHGADALQFLEALTRRLQVSPSFIHDAL